jgi:hypothetical protein
MVSFLTKNPNLGKFCSAYDWKMLIYILLPFGIFHRHLGYVMTIWHILDSFGIFLTVFGNL